VSPARVMRARLASAAERTRTSTAWLLRPLTLPLVYGGMLIWWERWDSHPVGQTATDLQTISVALPSTLPWGRRSGVAGGTRTRSDEGHGLAPRRLRHRPQSARRESHPRLSLIGRVHACRATGGRGLGDWNCTNVLEVPNPALCLAELHPGRSAVPHGRESPGGCHTTRPLHAASESNAAPRIWTPEPSQTAAYERRTCHREDSNLRQRPSQCRVPNPRNGGDRGRGGGS
jgi:hypothetical protein